MNNPQWNIVRHDYDSTFVCSLQQNPISFLDIARTAHYNNLQANYFSSGGDRLENTDLSFYIHKLSNHTDRISHAIYNRKELNECSLTSLFVLDFLYAHRDQRLCQRDIEDEFFINRATASKMLRLMEEKQLIRRTVSDEDKRSKTIELLEKGLELQRKCGAIRQGTEEALGEALTPREIEQFKAICRKMLAHLE